MSYRHRCPRCAVNHPCEGQDSFFTHTIRCPVVGRIKVRTKRYPGRGAYPVLEPVVPFRGNERPGTRRAWWEDRA